MSFSVCHFSPSPISHPSIESIERTMVGKSSRHFASNSRIPENPSSTKPIQPYSSADSTRIYIYIHVGGGSKGHVYRFLKSSHNVGDGRAHRAQGALENLAMEKGNRARIGRNLWDALLGCLLLSFSRFIRPPLCVSLLFFVSSLSLSSLFLSIRWFLMKVTFSISEGFQIRVFLVFFLLITVIMLRAL